MALYPALYGAFKDLGVISVLEPTKAMKGLKLSQFCPIKRIAHEATKRSRGKR